MFSARLRRLPTWAPAVSQLTDPYSFNLQERYLPDHDIELHVRSTPTGSFSYKTSSAIDDSHSHSLRTHPRNSSLPSSILNAFPLPPTADVTQPPPVPNVTILRFVLIAPSEVSPSMYETTKSRLASVASTAKQSKTPVRVFIFVLQSDFTPNTAIGSTNLGNHLPSGSTLREHPRTVGTEDPPLFDLDQVKSMIGSAATTGEHENETARLLKYDRGTTKNIRNYLHQDDTHKDTLRVFAQVQALTLIIPDLRDIGAQVVPLSEVGMLGAYIKRFGNAVSKGDTSALRSQDRSCDGESAFRFSGNFTSSVSSEESDRELAKKVIKKLLPIASLTPPVPEHYVLMLTDLYESLRDLAQGLATNEGQQKVMQTFEEADGRQGRQVAEDMIGFWLDECVLE